MHEKVQSLLELLPSGLTLFVWKSSSSFEDGLWGRRDIDILVAEQSLSKLVCAATSLGYIHVKAPSERHLSGAIDLLYLCGTSMSWIHLHVHTEICVGPKAFKFYRLANVDRILETAKRASGFYLPAPELELALYIIRKNLRSPFIIGDRNSSISSTEVEELAELREASRDSSAVLEWIQCFSGRSRKPLEQLDAEIAHFSVKSRLQFKKLFGKGRLKPWPVAEISSYLRRLIVHSKLALVRIGLGALTRRRRALSGAGFIVPIVGIDGSGKSYLSKAAYSVIDRKFDCELVYLGLGASGGVLSIFSARIAAAFAMCVPFLAEEVSWLRGFILRSAQLFLVKRAVSLGKIVVLDRLWVNRCGAMDGILPSRHSWLRERSRQQILKLYSLPIDPVLILRADVGTLESRRGVSADEARRLRAHEAQDFIQKKFQCFLVDNSKANQDKSLGRVLELISQRLSSVRG